MVNHTESFTISNSSYVSDRSTIAVGLLLVLVTYFAAQHWALSSRADDLPSINYGTTFWAQQKAKFKWLKNAPGLIMEGFEKFSGRAFRIMSVHGPLIMLPPDYIEAINAEDKLNFNKFVEEIFMADFDTFRTMRPPPYGMFEEAVMKGLTRALPKYTKALSQTMSECLRDYWGEQRDWLEIPIQKNVYSWVGLLSTRIFLGERFCQDKEWLQITTDFTVNLFTAIMATSIFHPILRPVVDLVSPLNRKVRKDLHRAVAIIKPILKERHEEIAKAEAEGREPVLPNDAIEWFRSAARGRKYDEADIQISLAVAAIHTTTDLLTQTLLNMAIRPEHVDVLRQEVVDVLGRHGLSKMALLDLHLLDSFIKETQRLKPIGMASMHRKAMADVELPGGIKIRKGEHTAISSYRMWDGSVYPDPLKFDPYRFSEMRKDPKHTHQSHLVATSPDHLGFAHGKHACPGRFFAANEVKIALIQIIMKYDLKVADSSMVEPIIFGINQIINPKAKLQIRSRTPEVDLDALAAAL